MKRSTLLVGLVAVLCMMLVGCSSFPVNQQDAGTLHDAIASGIRNTQDSLAKAQAVAATQPTAANNAIVSSLTESLHQQQAGLQISDGLIQFTSTPLTPEGLGQTGKSLSESGVPLLATIGSVSTLAALIWGSLQKKGKTTATAQKDQVQEQSDANANAFSQFAEGLAAAVKAGKATLTPEAINIINAAVPAGHAGANSALDTLTTAQGQPPLPN